MDIALERVHVGCAGAMVFAGNLHGDILGEEVADGGVDELV